MSTLADTTRWSALQGAPAPRQLGALCCPTDEALCRPGQAMPWLRLIIGLFVAGQTMVLALAINITPPESETVRIVLQSSMLGTTLLVMALLGWPLLVESLRALRQRRLTMELLFLICLAGAFSISCQSMWTGSGPVYFEVVAVLLIVYSLGRSVSIAGRRKALAAMGELNDALAQARLIDPVTRETEWRHVESIQPGQRVLVTAGELIPVDGRIVKGSAYLQESAFTGEWSSATRHAGDRVLAGTACLDGPLEIEASTAGTDRRIDRMTTLVDQARRQPTTMQRQADRFVQWFLPVVCLTASGTFLYWWQQIDLHTALFNALAVLLVACPCAAGLATPLVLWSVLGKLARRGLFIRSGDAVERLAHIDSVIFDKTGTLGDDALCVERFAMEPGVKELTTADVLALIHTIEAHVNHPVAEVLRTLDVPSGARVWELIHLRILPGRGIEADVQPAGGGAPHTARIIQDDNRSGANHRVLRIDFNDSTVARVTIRERLRDQAASCIRHLQRQGLNVQIMTGDTAGGASTVEDLAPTTAAMTPEDKHRAIRRLQTEGTGFQRSLYVGDGFNDAPAMAAAHVGIALAKGAPVTVEAASATLHQPDLDVIPRAVHLARQAVRLVRSHLHWAVAYNLAGMLAAAMGYLHPVAAALLMAASSLLVSWRSFHLTEKLTDSTEALPEERDRRRGDTLAAPATALVESNPRTLATWTTLHTVGLVGQGILLAIIGGWSFGYILITAAIFLALAALALYAWPRMPAWMDMTFAMVTLGGFGMNLGWWADLGFNPATAAFMCPCSQASAGHGSAILNWMNAGMLLLGVPAMFIVRRIKEPFDIRRWCCGGMIVLGIPGMVIGMMTGSLLAHHLAQTWPLWLTLVLDYALMILGMCVGMLIPHMLEYAFPARWRAAARPERTLRTS